MFRFVAGLQDQSSPAAAAVHEVKNQTELKRGKRKQPWVLAAMTTRHCCCGVTWHTHTHTCTYLWSVLLRMLLRGRKRARDYQTAEPQKRERERWRSNKCQHDKWSISSSSSSSSATCISLLFLSSSSRPQTADADVDSRVWIVKSVLSILQPRRPQDRTESRFNNLISQSRSAPPCRILVNTTE